MLHVAVGALFALSLLLLSYTYLGYPLLLVLLGATTERSDPDRSGSNLPSVTMVVPVHNEASVIAEKVDNTEAITYAGDFHCLFVSDSTDRTEDILRTRMGERMALLRLPERRGKSHAINEALERVEADVVVFSDANTMYEPDAVDRLVAPLADDAVGCVTGDLRLRGGDGRSGEGLYWRYERWLRHLESELGTTVSTNGGALALRRRDIDPLPERALADDLVLTLRAAASGKRIYFEETAVVTERATADLFEEFRRRVRIGAGDYQALAWFAHLASPTRGVLALEFVSHKVLRWLGPWLLALAAIANIALVALSPSVVLLSVLGVQIVGYSLAAIGTASSRFRRLWICRVPAYFVVMNMALAVGLLRALGGRADGSWRVTARE